MSMGKVLTLIVFVLLISGANAAVPVLTSLDNSISSDLYPKVEKGTSITFATDYSPSTTYYWLVDGTEQGTHLYNITLSWASVGSKNVTVYATNVSGSSNILTAFPTIKRIMAEAGDVHATYSEEGTDEIQSSLDSDTPDAQGIFWGVSFPYRNTLGDIFFLFLYGLPMLLIWVSTKKMILPVVICIIFQVLFLGSIPAAFLLPAGLFITLTIVGIYNSLTRDRGT